MVESCFNPEKARLLVDGHKRFLSSCCWLKAQKLGRGSFVGTLRKFCHVKLETDGRWWKQKPGFSLH